MVTGEEPKQSEKGNDSMLARTPGLSGNM